MTARPHEERLSGMVSVARINARKSKPRSENAPTSLDVRAPFRVSDAAHKEL